MANGYWLCQVIGVENGGHEITPLYGELYSQEAEDFVSENHEILKAIEGINAATEHRGIWVMDRGGDRGRLYDTLVPGPYRFMIRQKGDRHLRCGTRTAPALLWAQGCPLSYETTIVREEQGQEKVYHLRYGFRPVRLPKYPEVPLWLVVVQGLGQQPLMLLTNLAVRKNRKVLWWMVSAYLTRWRIEETLRFAKQTYQIEDVRVLRYNRLRNLVVLVTAVMYFTFVVLGTKLKLRILASHVLKAAKRLFGIPDFRYYAFADGIQALLTRFPRKASKPTHDPGVTQMALFDT